MALSPPRPTPRRTGEWPLQEPTPHGLHAGLLAAMILNPHLLKRVQNKFELWHEIYAAVPAAIALGLDHISAATWSIIGNYTPVLLIVFGYEHLMRIDRLRTLLLFSFISVAAYGFLIAIGIDKGIALFAK